LVKLSIPLQRALQSLAPDLPYADVKPFQSIIDPKIRSWKLGATLFGAFGALALLLAAIGLYSTISYTVVQRTSEMGIRMALGARAGDVVALIMKEGLRVAIGGVVAGVIIALLLSGRIAPLLFETQPHDPAVFLSVAAVLIVVASLATLLPARRATRVEPSSALRSE